MVQRMIIAAVILGALSLIVYRVVNKQTASKKAAEEIAADEEEELALDEETMAEIA